MKGTFKESQVNLDKHLTKNRIANIDNPDIITEEEEFNVLCGKGIDYKMNGISIYIPALRLFQMLEVKNLDKIEYTEDGMEEAFKTLSNLLKVDVQLLKDNMEMWHFKEIIELLVYATKLGSKKLFEKKTVSVSREITQ